MKPASRLPVAFLFLAIMLAGCQSGGGAGPVTLRSDDPGLADLWFMTGRWSTVPSSGSRVEEHWTTASAGTMLGVSRTVQAGDTIFFEFIRVERTPDGVFFFASPRGEGQTAFRLTESGGNRAVFENPENDFPTRITYERLPDGRLHAMIEGTQRGRPRSEHWYYRPLRIGAAGG